MASKSKRRLTRALSTMLGKKQDTPDYIPGLLGAYIGQGRPMVQVEGRPDYVWVRIRGATSEPVQAFNEKVAPHFDLPVLIERDPTNPTRWIVVGRDSSVYPNWEGEVYLPQHAHTHSFAGVERTGADVVWVYKRQFTPLLPRPQTTGNYTIFVQAGYYFDNDQYYWWPGSGSPSLQPYLPSGGSNAKFATVYLNTTIGVLEIVSGPEFNPYAPGVEFTDYITVPTNNNAIPLAAVFLTSGTHYVGWNEIYDLRFAPEPHKDGSGTYPLVYEDGGFVGVAQDVNFTGAGVSVSISGTRIQVDISGGGGGGSGTYLPTYEDGLLEGTATEYNFVGDGVSVAFSGTRAEITIPGGGSGGTGTVQVLWDGENIVAGAKAIDYNGGVRVEASGTRASVDVLGISRRFINDGEDFIVPDGYSHVVAGYLEVRGSGTYSLEGDSQLVIL